MLSASISKTAHTTPSKSGLVTTLIGFVPLPVEGAVAVIPGKKQTGHPVFQPVDDKGLSNQGPVCWAKAIPVSTILLNRNSQWLMGRGSDRDPLRTANLA
jgi:hypothetical protein